MSISTNNNLDNQVFKQYYRYGCQIITNNFKGIVEVVSSMRITSRSFKGFGNVLWHTFNPITWVICTTSKEVANLHCMVQLVALFGPTNFK